MISLRLLSGKALGLLPGTADSEVSSQRRATVVLVFVTSALLIGTLLAVPLLGPVVLILLAIVVISLMSFLRPSFGLFVFVFLLYSRTTEVVNKGFGIPVALPGIAPMFAVLLLTALVVAEGPAIFKRFRLGDWIPFLIYGLVLLASVAVALSPARAESTVYDYARDVSFFVLVMLAIRRIHDLRFTVWGIILGAALPALLTIYQVISGTTNQFHGFGQLTAQSVITGSGHTVLRPAGPIDDPNFYALVLIPVLPLALYRFHRERSRFLRFVALVAAVVIPIAALLTYSRGGFIALIVVIVCCVLVGLIPVRAFALMLVLTLLAIPIVSPTYVARFAGVTQLLSSKTGAATDSSIRGRSLEVEAGLIMFVEHPLLGVGAYNYNVNFQDVGRRLGIQTRTQRSPHSLYVQILAETGIAGMLAFIVLVGSAFYHILRVRKATERGSELHGFALAVGVAFIGFLAGTTFLHASYPRYIWLYLTLPLAAYALLRDEGVFVSAAQEPGATVSYKTLVPRLAVYLMLTAVAVAATLVVIQLLVAR